MVLSLALTILKNKWNFVVTKYLCTRIAKGVHSILHVGIHRKECWGKMCWQHNNITKVTVGGATMDKITNCYIIKSLTVLFTGG